MVHQTRLKLTPLAVGFCRHCARVTRRGAPWYIHTFPSICFLIQHPVLGAILYDTGYSEHFMTATQSLPELGYRWVTPVTLLPEQSLGVQLLALGVLLQDIRFCFISHFHADHMAGLRDLPNATFICFQAAFQKVRHLGRWQGVMQAYLPALLPPDFLSRVWFIEDKAVLPLSGVWQVFGQGFDVFGDGSVLAVLLAGHAIGQMGLLFRDADDREVLLCADACWSRDAYMQQAMPSVLVRPLMASWSSYRKTLMALHSLRQEDSGVCILPSHCAASMQSYQQRLLLGV